MKNKTFINKLSLAEFYLPNISVDRISDMTTKVIKKQLIEFTQDQCNKLGIKMHPQNQKDLLNNTTLVWEKSAMIELPIYDNKPIIFVPKIFVRDRGGASRNLNSFYRFAIRNFIATDPKMLKKIIPTGKNKEIQLKDIKEAYPLNKTTLQNWSVDYTKLFVDFETKKRKLTHMTDYKLPNV